MTIDTERLPATGQWHYVSASESGTVCLQLRISNGFAAAERIAYSASGKAARSNAADQCESSDLREAVNWLKAQHVALAEHGWTPMRRSGSALRIDLSAAPSDLDDKPSEPSVDIRRPNYTGAFGLPAAPIASLGMRLYAGPRR